MTTLLLLEDSYEGRREFFEASDVEKAIKQLKRWVIQNKDRDVFLFKISPGKEEQITSGFELFGPELIELDTKTGLTEPDLSCKKKRKISKPIKSYYDDGFDNFCGKMIDDFDKDGNMI